MAGAIVQQRTAVTNSGSTTISDTITGVTAGNTLVAHVGCDNGGGTITISGVSDGTAYSLGDAKRTDSGNNQFGTVYYLENAGSGSHTVTATATGGTPSNMLLRLFEVSGLQTASSLDKNIGQFQSAPGTGANGVSSSATAATTNANDFIMGFTQNTGEAFPGTSTITAGSGFTKSGTDNYMAAESKSVAATGAQTATFTQSVATQRISHVVVFKETAAGFTKTASDSLSLSDSAVAIGNHVKTASDSLTLSDSAVEASLLPRTASDSLSLSDSAVEASNLPRTAGDTLSLTDSGVSSFVPGGKSASDSLSLSNSAACIFIKQKSASDIIVFTDSAIASGGNTGHTFIAANYVGLDIQQAGFLAYRAGFDEVLVTQQRIKGILVGQVVAQIPSAGSTVTMGSDITFTIVQGNVPGFTYDFSSPYT